MQRAAKTHLYHGQIQQAIFFLFFLFFPDIDISCKSPPLEALELSSKDTVCIKCQPLLFRES